MSVIFGEFRNYKASARKALFRQFGLFPPDGQPGGYSFNHIVEAGVTLRLLPLLGGDQDGSNTVFVVRRANPVLTWNGQALTQDLDFVVSSTTPSVTVTFIVAPGLDVILREAVNV